MKRLIVTGDDFGLAIPVNEAIEAAHLGGILTTTSLMVGEDASGDAVERAKRLPALKVGLHLVLVEGKPILPAEMIPDLVGSDGRFSDRKVPVSLRCFFRPSVREQVRDEIRAQFDAFRKTGLTLDHVNAHQHLHLHPTVLGIVLSVGREYGLKAVRMPYEPPVRSWRASGTSLGPRMAFTACLSPWMRLMRHRLRRAGIRHNDYVFGLHDSGSMAADLVLRMIRNLPEGVTEIYFHPATRRCPEIDRTMAGYRHEEELRALTSGRVLASIAGGAIQRVAFCDL